MIFKSDRSQGELNGFLDAGSHIQGELHFEDTFRVDGRLTGKVVSKGDLVVGERGEIDGEIEVGRVFISGTVRGSVQASQRVEITAGARAYANLKTPSLVIEDGAFFEGGCAMVRSGTPRTEPEPGGVVTRMPLSKEG